MDAPLLRNCYYDEDHDSSFEEQKPRDGDVYERILDKEERDLIQTLRNKLLVAENDALGMATSSSPRRQQQARRASEPFFYRDSEDNEDHENSTDNPKSDDGFSSLHRRAALPQDDDDDDIVLQTPKLISTTSADSLGSHNKINSPSANNKGTLSRLKQASRLMGAASNTTDKDKESTRKTDRESVVNVAISPVNDYPTKTKNDPLHRSLHRSYHRARGKRWPSMPNVFKSDPIATESARTTHHLRKSYVTANTNNRSAHAKSNAGRGGSFGSMTSFAYELVEEDEFLATPQNARPRLVHQPLQEGVPAHFSRLPFIDKEYPEIDGSSSYLEETIADETSVAWDEDQNLPTPPKLLRPSIAKEIYSSYQGNNPLDSQSSQSEIEVSCSSSEATSDSAYSNDSSVPLSRMGSNHDDNRKTKVAPDHVEQQEEEDDGDGYTLDANSLACESEVSCSLHDFDDDEGEQDEDSLFVEITYHSTATLGRSSSQKDISSFLKDRYPRKGDHRKAPAAIRHHGSRDDHK